MQTSGISILSVILSTFILLFIGTLIWVITGNPKFVKFTISAGFGLVAIAIGSVFVSMHYVNMDNILENVVENVVLAAVATFLIVVLLMSLYRLLLEQKRIITFAHIVSDSVVKRRIMFLGLLIILCIAAFPEIGISLPILAVVLVIGLDLTLVLYRQSRTLYGDNDLEFSEAVRYVITEDKSNGPEGPRRFDRVFPIPKPKVESLPVPKGGLTR